ncbi:MAG: pyridoxal phosphate-dependent aminotransferase [Candidatus Marinimicrobia bacterium]|nr:pyridoxal phosphate-dependent aminotransferase [Candidatus Neomarinimicrobiota bacterium]
MNEKLEQILEKAAILKRFANKTKSNDEIDFVISEPNFPIPAVIRNVAQEIALSGKLNYTSTEGLEKLRKLIAEKFHHMPGPNGVTVTVGASEALYSIVTSLIKKDDEVLVPALRNPSYDATIILSNGNISEYKINDADENQFVISNIEKKINDKTKMIILNNPLDPTGQIISFEDMIILAEICKEKNIFLVVDESYNEIRYSKKKYLTASGLNENVIVFTTLSKLFSMTGWRLGWILSSENISQKLNILRKYSVTCASTVSQQLAIRIMKGSGEKSGDKILSVLSNRRKLMIESFNKHGLKSFVAPAGGYYLFFKYSDYLDKSLESNKFSEMLMKEKDILTVPGRIFGNSGEGYIRVSFATGEINIQKGVMLIKEFIDDLNNFNIVY